MANNGDWCSSDAPAFRLIPMDHPRVGGGRRNWLLDWEIVPSSPDAFSVISAAGYTASA